MYPHRPLTTSKHTHISHAALPIHVLLYSSLGVTAISLRGAEDCPRVSLQPVRVLLQKGGVAQRVVCLEHGGAALGQILLRGPIRRGGVRPGVCRGRRAPTALRQANWAPTTCGGGRCCQHDGGQPQSGARSRFEHHAPVCETSTLTFARSGGRLRLRRRSGRDLLRRGGRQLLEFESASARA